MPTFSWRNKSNPAPGPANLELDGYVYPGGVGYIERSQALPENRLILGDNMAVMSALLPEYEGKIQLIYADPPFFTNRRFPARIGRGEDSRKPEEWQLVEGYPDHWDDLDAYLEMLYSRLVLMHRLLSPSGSLYLHLDWHADAYARLLLDEIFGPDRLLNEIIWVYHGPSPIRSAFNRKHDTILAYTKTKDYVFNVDAVRQPYDPNTVKTFNSSIKAGFGKVPDLERGKVPEDWWYFPVVARLHKERTGYPTQKPAALLERIILASTQPGDLTADFFCGSGTAPATAARLGRRFLAGDVTWRAIHTTRLRLASMPTLPFRLETDVRFPLHCLEVSQWDPAVRVIYSGCSAQLECSHPEDIDYWEVDPDWDGKTFRSAAQAVRPLDDRPIPLRLELPVPASSRPCARLVLANGDHYLLV